MVVKKEEKFVPDTSALIKGIVSRQIENKKISPKEIIIHEAVLAELEHQANTGKAIGHIGLDEIALLHELAKKNNFKVLFAGRRPRADEIKRAFSGVIDAMIRDFAFENNAVLITSDKIQAKIAEAKNMKVNYEDIILSENKSEMKLTSFFDNTTMSVHLREGFNPIAKKGMPGNWKFEKLKKELMTSDEIQDISKEIIELAKGEKNGFIEIQRNSSTIVQLDNYRIVITKPPFSDGWEITAVRPVKKMTLEEYNLVEKLYNRFAEQAEGILIAGSPGSGKSTFASALAEYYASQDKIVKTMESPRDMMLSDKITQYSLTYGTPQELHDILLLSRPDYTFFDEMRNTKDFHLFSDLRLSGIGLVGVLHSTNPIDAVQRFVGKIELGVIPHVIDTVVFIKNGMVDKVLEVKMTVKMPSGMTEADLARPVVEVKDFKTGKLEFEIYSFGEETVVVPVSGTTSKKSPALSLASSKIEDFFSKMASKVKVEMTSPNKAVVYVPSNAVGKIIGRAGKNIDVIEKKLGVGIDIKEFDELPDEAGKSVDFDFHHRKSSIILYVDEFSTPIDFFVNGQFVFTATSSKKGEIKVGKSSKVGKLIDEAIKNNNLELRIG